MKIKFLHSYCQRLLRLVGLFVITLCLTLIPLSSPGIIQTPLALAQQCQAKYQAEDYLNAVDCWQKAITRFKAEGDLLNQAMAMSNLSLSQQKLGQWEQAEKEINSSLQLLRSLQPNPEQQKVLAQSLDIQGLFYWSTGQNQQALDIWKEATEVYQQIGDRTGIIRSQLNQAQALQALGYYFLARVNIEEAQKNLKSVKDPALQVIALRSLGNVLRQMGDLKEAQEVLAEAQKLELSPEDIGATTLDIANIKRALWKKALFIGDEEQEEECLTGALQDYRFLVNIGNKGHQVVKSERKLMQTESKKTLCQNYPEKLDIQEIPIALKLKAQLNLLNLLVETKEWQPAYDLSRQIKFLLHELPSNRTKVFVQIKLAENLSKLAKQGQVENKEVAELLAKAYKQSQLLKDQRAESLIQGSLGKLYEESQQLVSAQELTNKALDIAQNIHAPDIAYRWQWQLGRIFKEQAQQTKDNELKNAAITAYEKAIKTLQSVRTNLTPADPDIQFAFREKVEPLYRELADLLLTTEGDVEPTQKRLKQATGVIDALQLAEIEDFLRCNRTWNVDLKEEEVDPKAAFIYPIILADRTEVIVKLPQSQGFRHHKIPSPKKEVEKKLKDMRIQLEQNYIDTSFGQTVYEWLLKPVENDFQKNKIKTLVFILDSSFRNIPMATLHDGEQYLIEKGYAVARLPGLKLLQPQALKQIELNALTFGISEFPEYRRVPNLPAVKTELSAISFQLSTRQFLNKEFTNKTFQENVSFFSNPIVHVATHGQFSSDPEETFILAWYEPIQVRELSNFLSLRDKNLPEAIELLVLSACQTLTGDSRASLGLAGLAVQSGARSTIASLWSVDDKSTAKLMKFFYEYLAKGDKTMTKAEALRLAQLQLVEDYEPSFWAPFVLVGNWL